MKDLHAKEQLVKEELDQLNNERSDYLQRRARFEFDIKDAEEESRQAKVNSELAQHELTRLEAQIKRSEESLNKIKPEYDALRSKEADLTRQRDICDQKKNEIYAKQGRSTTFRTKEDRDVWIKNELKKVKKAIQDKKQLLGKIRNELTEGQKK
jgi:structural maintenance of chromosome 3 (chondroitin sulfate proteoglycan 6)